MRFHRIRLEAFGRLRDLDTGPDPLPGVVVVSGPNEAGKSSFFEALVAVLYGLYPASRETNPWAPWDGATLSVEARILGDDGICRDVHRRLLSSPTGSLVREETEEALRNRTLPGAEHVPRRVYRQVFALTLAELAGLEGEGWAAVQDRLVGALGARDLRPAREVADELEREAGALWRPNRRGRQEVRELGERIRELEYRRRGVRDEERAARDARAELARRKTRLDEARREREECRVRLARDRREGPLLRRLARLRELEAAAGDPSEVEDLPRDPAAERRRLERELLDAEATVARLEAAATAPRRAIEAFDDRRRTLLEQEAALEAHLARAATGEAERTRIGQLKQEVADLDRRIRTAVDAIPTWRQADEAHLLGPSVPEVRRAVDEARRESERRPAVPSASLLSAAGALLLLVVSAALLWGNRPLIAGAAAAIALILAWIAIRKGRRAGATRPVDDVPAPVSRALCGLPDPPPGLVAEVPVLLERVQELLRDRADRRDRLERHRLALEKLGAEILAFVDALPQVGPVPPSPAAALHMARAEVREAARLGERADAARDELERVTGERATASERVETLREALAQLDRRLQGLGDDGTVAAGLAAAERRLHALMRGRELRAELDEEDPDLLAALEPRAGVEPDPFRGHQVPSLIAREQGLGEEIERLAREIEGLTKDLDRLARRETLDLLDGEIRTLEEKRTRLVRHRDLLHLLARLVRDADRTVREDYQPDVLRAAGRHLATLTGGRYDRILVGGDDLASFRVRGSGAPSPVPVEAPLSTGTREQAYLALRLALLDPLDRGGERLPLVLDEVFVNWDAERLRRGLRLLADESATRQIFLFTCHEELADAATLATGAHRIVLPAP